MSTYEDQQQQTAAQAQVAAGAVLTRYADGQLPLPDVPAALAVATLAAKRRAAAQAEAAAVRWAWEHGEPDALPQGQPVAPEELPRLEQAFSTVAEQALARLDALEPQVDRLDALLDKMDAQVAELEQDQAERAPVPSKRQQVRNVVMVGTRKPPPAREPAPARSPIAPVTARPKDRAGPTVTRTAPSKPAIASKAPMPSKRAEPAKSQPNLLDLTEKQKAKRLAAARARLAARRGTTVPVPAPKSPAEPPTPKPQVKAPKPDAEKARRKAAKATLREADRLDRERMAQDDLDVDASLERQLAEALAEDLAAEMLTQIETVVRSETLQGGFEALGLAFEEQGTKYFKWVAESRACKFCKARAQKIYRKRLVFPEHAQCSCYTRPASQDEIDDLLRKKRND